MKKNLPVILLKNIVLLPNNELHLEFDNDESKNILEISNVFHNNKIIIVSTNDDEQLLIKNKQAEEIGVIAKLSNKISLPNGKVRVTLTGLRRSRVTKYISGGEEDIVLEAFLEELDEEKIKNEKELVMEVKESFQNYVRQIPFLSNDLIKKINEEKNLSLLTDAIVPYLPFLYPKQKEYLLETKASVRASSIINDLKEQLDATIIEKELDLKLRDGMDQTQRDYILREKMRLIQEELGEQQSAENLLETQIKKFKGSESVKKRLEEDYSHLKELQTMSPEYSVIKTYIEWLLSLPYNKFTKDNFDLKKSKEVLEREHAGLEEVKTRILEYLAVKQMNPKAEAPILCFVGPPGVGKTSFAYSIANAMKKKFVKISVGGLHDESEIKGHRKTYLGANPGRILQSMKKVGVSNPVFLIDEVDKMTIGNHGDPASALLEVLDPTQNKHFSDHYIEEEYDLSNVMFVLTANEYRDIPEPLLDRLEIIELSGYTEYEKLEIAKQHLIKDVMKSHGIRNGRINFSDSVIFTIIRNYTKEAGVRELKRQFEKICRKVVTQILLDEKKFSNYKITKKDLMLYLGKPKFQDNKIKRSDIGVVNGLAYTSYGGDTLPIEVNFYPGKGDLVLTGSLGDVMKESATIALSYIKSSADKFKIPFELFKNNNIHIHVPEGAIKKDGPSAGIALTSALISAFTKKHVKQKTAMTGEITLRGDVLAIGGLKEKSMGAIRNGIKTIIVPLENKNDFDDLPKEIKEQLTVKFVSHYDEVYNILFDETLEENLLEEMIAN